MKKKIYMVAVTALAVILLFATVITNQKLDDVQTGIRNRFDMYATDLAYAFDAGDLDEQFIASAYRFESICPLYDDGRWYDLSRQLARLTSPDLFARLDDNDRQTLANFLTSIRPFQQDISSDEAHSTMEMLAERLA